MRHVIMKGVVSLPGLIALLLFTSLTASAHPEHDFVQASYLTFTEDTLLLDIDLRPGFEISPQVLAAIDTDSDGLISELEATDYADQITAALRLEINRQPMVLTRVGMGFPSASMLENGLGIIQFHFSALLPNTSPGDYELFYENAFAPEDLTSQYLVNGFVENSALNTIDITNQERDWEQQTITIRYTILTTPVPVTSNNTRDDEIAPDAHTWQHLIEDLQELFFPSLTG